MFNKLMRHFKKVKKAEEEPVKMDASSKSYIQLKYEDGEGNIHVIDGFDYEAFDEVMGHKEYKLIFD